MSFDVSSKKIAIVHDDFIQFGGAEKLVETLFTIFPQADLFSSYVSKKWKKRLLSKFPKTKIETSFIQKFPLVHKYYKFLALIYPISFEAFNFDNYDIVISSSARFAHGIITKPKTLHVAYINSVGRMFWNSNEYFERSNKLLRTIVTILICPLRIWSKVSSSHPDYIIANSSNIQNQVKKMWKRESKVIYPFHEISVNRDKMKKYSNSAPFILVSRLESWKRADIAVTACSNLKVNLVVVGDGKDINRLKNLADIRYVKFLGRLKNADLVKEYRNSRALIITQKEDFGITSIEAQACGIPVIALKEGGVLETVIEGKTGEFFENQNTESLEKVLKKFDCKKYDLNDCLQNAGLFSKERFKKDFTEYIRQLL